MDVGPDRRTLAHPSRGLGRRRPESGCDLELLRSTMGPRPGRLEDRWARREPAVRRSALGPRDAYAQTMALDLFAGIGGAPLEAGAAEQL